MCCSPSLALHLLHLQSPHTYSAFFCLRTLPEQIPLCPSHSLSHPVNSQLSRFSSARPHLTPELAHALLELALIASLTFHFWHFLQFVILYFVGLYSFPLSSIAISSLGTNSLSIWLVILSLVPDQLPNIK